MNKLSLSFISLAVLLLVGQDAFPQLAPDSSMLAAFTYRNLGPKRGGRVTAVAGVPDEPGTFYMGATGGGVWKTENFGLSWHNISDGYFATPSIGAIAVAPSDPNTLYVGTGSDGIRSNVISGKGVYKSTDAGASWQFAGLEKAGQIGAVLIHPQYPEVVFVAAIGNAFAPNKERGVYRSLDGGASWEQVLFHSDTVGAADLEFCPDDPNTLYATLWRAERKPWTIISGGEKTGGIYKSTDLGKSWKKLEKGLPKGLIGKIDLAVTPADPDRLYALVEAPPGEGGLYVSHNRGKSFELVSTKKELLDRPFYYCNVEADPNQPEVVYVMATRFFKSEDGGKKWKSMRVPHGDNHDMWINPHNSNLFIQSNDGGANITQDGGKSWSTQHNQPTAELYQVEVDEQFPYWLYAGQQDNSTIAVPSLPPYPAPAGPDSYWLSVGGCETGPAVPKPGNPNIVYSNCKGRFGVYNKLTGQEMQYYVGAANMYGQNPKDLKYRFQRVSPIHVSPHKPDVVYHASQFVHKTTDDGQHWETISPDLTAFTPETQVISGFPITRDITGEEFYSTIYAIRESPLKEGLIWVGANDGPVHLTQDGGQHWQEVTPPDLPPGGRVDCVEPSPHREGKAYIAVLRYQLGDWQPYLYKTTDFGQSWQRLTTGTNGIPADFPVRVVREDPQREGLLYAGTEYGLFISMDDGKNWHSFQQNLPITPVTDIKVHRKDLVLSTMGRGFWIMDNLSPLHQLSPQTQTTAHLFKPRDAYRMRYWGGRNSSAIPAFPAVAADIDFFLPDSVQQLRLDILNPAGEVVRSFTQGAAKADSGAESGPDMATGFRPVPPAALLRSGRGFHRFRWDLRHRGSWTPNGTDRGGPMVSPGTYRLRLTVNEQVLEQNLEVRMDPRVQAAGVSLADLQAQEALSLQIRELESEARQLLAKVKDRRDQLKKVLEHKKKDKAALAEDEQLARIEDRLVTAEGRYMPPMLLDQIRYLAAMLRRADQRPGQDAYLRLAELKAELHALQPQLALILNKPASSDDE
ncbi:MAG: hypothetical protein D6730_25685 [Bacteroidetes bacterium]|nr:MAG: hypothetical protein D6730_25685 [Bacteroidota bacterium]